MSRFILAITLLLNAAPLWADARVAVLVDLLDVPKVISILIDEGVTDAQTLNDDMLDGQGGDFWNAQVARIYDPLQFQEKLWQALERGLDDAALDAAVAFYSTDAGARIVEMENAARRSISEPNVEQSARASVTTRADGDPDVAFAARFIDSIDLVERNVTAAMTANLKFLQGLSDGRYAKRSDADMLREVWAQQEDIRRDTREWLMAYLVMAYAPLSQDDLDAYLRFTQSPEGRALNAALFDGFEMIYQDVSYALGRALGLSAAGSDI